MTTVRANIRGKSQITVLTERNVSNGSFRKKMQQLITLRYTSSVSVAGFVHIYNVSGPVTVAARSKASVYGRSPAEIVGLYPTGGYGCLSVVSVVCCQVEVCTTS